MRSLVEEVALSIIEDTWDIEKDWGERWCLAKHPLQFPLPLLATGFRPSLSLLCPPQPKRSLPVIQGIVINIVSLNALRFLYKLIPIPQLFVLFFDKENVKKFMSKIFAVLLLCLFYVQTTIRIRCIVAKRTTNSCDHTMTGRKFPRVASQEIRR